MTPLQIERITLGLECNRNKSVILAWLNGNGVFDTFISFLYDENDFPVHINFMYRYLKLWVRQGNKYGVRCYTPNAQSRNCQLVFCSRYQWAYYKKTLPQSWFDEHEIRPDHPAIMESIVA